MSVPTRNRAYSSSRTGSDQKLDADPQRMIDSIDEVWCGCSVELCEVNEGNVYNQTIRTGSGEGPIILPSYHPTILPSYHPTILPSYPPTLLPSSSNQQTNRTSYHPTNNPTYHPAILLWLTVELDLLTTNKPPNLPSYCV